MGSISFLSLLVFLYPQNNFTVITEEDSNNGGAGDSDGNNQDGGSKRNEARNVGGSGNSETNPGAEEVGTRMCLDYAST